MIMNIGAKLVAFFLAATLPVATVAQAQSGSVPTSAGNVPTAPAAATQQAVGPDAMFSRWDKDHDKALSAAEFKAGWQEVQASVVLRQLHELFVARDANKSGSLESAEYANLELIRKAGTSAPPMSGFDADKNQALDFKEYLAMIDVMAKNQP